MSGVGFAKCERVGSERLRGGLGFGVDRGLAVGFGRLGQRARSRSRGSGCSSKQAMWYADPMTRDQVKEILDRVLTWPPQDQERVARFVRAVEERRAGDDITDEEWKIIEERAARRDLATDEEVEQVFSRYRSA